MKDSFFDDVENPWEIIKSYFHDKGHLDRLVRHQLESYNHFVKRDIEKTITMFNPVHIKSDKLYHEKSGKNALEIFITFDNFSVFRPQIHENTGAIKLMFPNEARLRNFTYASNMLIDLNIEYIIREGENFTHIRKISKKIPNIHIGKIPVMLKSEICILTQYSLSLIHI